MMKVERLLSIATQVFRQKFREICPESVGEALTAETVGELCRVFHAAFSARGTATLKAHIESFEVTPNSFSSRRSRKEEQAQDVNRRGKTSSTGGRAYLESALRQPRSHRLLFIGLRHSGSGGMPEDLPRLVPGAA